MMATFWLVLLSTHLTAVAASIPFPYTNRTKEYSAWTATSRGDLTTVGMSGATVALPFDISAAEPNPAGFAMQSYNISAEINAFQISDPRIQRSGDEVTSAVGGLALKTSKWGLGMGFYTPMTETGTYLSPTTGTLLATNIAVLEYRFVVAHTFFNEKLSLGASLDLVHAMRDLGSNSYGGNAMGYHIGALAHLSKKIYIGAGYAPEVVVGPGTGPLQADLPGFNQNVHMPMNMSLGVGYVPSRYFRVGLELQYTDATLNTALLADQTIITGVLPTLTPRLGVNYLAAEFKNLTITGQAGFYYETSRITGLPNQFHNTLSLQVNPYFINSGIGYDIASTYQNLMFFVGLDIVRVFRTFDLIPPDPHTTYDGFLPRVNAKEEEEQFKQPSLQEVEKIITDIPDKIVNKVTPVFEQIEDRMSPKKLGKPKKKKQNRTPTE